jgi:N-acetylglucosamine kinase-like BadF-type ATPase
MGLLLGIDGGSTKTAAVLITDEGDVLAYAQLPGSATGSPVSPQTASVLASAVQLLCSQAGVSQEEIRVCGIGLCGIDFEDELPVQREGIAAALTLPQERVVLVNDGIVALWGATAKPAATILQHGSGFTGAYRVKHGDEVLFDHLSIANTFDMRRALVALVARMINGMAEATPLKDKALAHFGIEDEQQYCEAVYRRRIPHECMRSTPPLIFSSWLAGDPGAGQLVESAIRDYALVAQAMVAATRIPDPDVTFGGGLLAQAPDEFWESLACAVRESHPDVTVKPPDLPPEYGGAIMAGHRVGLDPVQLFSRLGTSAKKKEA